MQVNFLMGFYSKFKIIRYWAYLLIILAFFYFLFNYYTCITDPILVAVVNTLILVVLIVLEQLDFGVKELIKFFHSRLLDVKEVYVLSLIVATFILTIFFGNLIHSKTVEYDK